MIRAAAVLVLVAVLSAAHAQECSCGGETAASEAPPAHVLYVTITGSYNSDMLYGLTVLQNEIASHPDLIADGSTVTGHTLTSSNPVPADLSQYTQIWVNDLSTGTDNHATSYQRIADWFNNATFNKLPEVIADGRYISSLWRRGDPNRPNDNLIKNYFHNLRVQSGGRGCVLATDHNTFQTGINTLMSLINLNNFFGNMVQTYLNVDKENVLMSYPYRADLGQFSASLDGLVWDDSSAGSTPYGIQPNGQVLYPLGYHQGDQSQPGISTSISGGAGFVVGATLTAQDIVQTCGTLVRGVDWISLDWEATIVNRVDGNYSTAGYSWQWELDGQLVSTAQNFSLSAKDVFSGWHTMLLTATDPDDFVATASYCFDIDGATACPGGYTYVACSSICVSDTRATGASSDGTSAMTAYTAGLGSEGDANFIEPCSTFDNLGNDFMVIVEMGDFTDYFIPSAENVTVCDMLNSNNNHLWTERVNIDSFSAPPYAATTGTLGGSATDAGLSPNRTTISFWGGAGENGGCCHSTANDSPSFGQPFSLSVAPTTQPYEHQCPGRCGSYSSAASGYYYSPTPDAHGCLSPVEDNCFYEVHNLTTEYPASLRLEGDGAPESRLDGSYLYLSFNLPVKYYSVRLLFADAAPFECEHEDWELVSNDVDSTVKDHGCFFKYEFRMPWPDAYSSPGTTPGAYGGKCGWQREEANNQVKLTLDFAVSVREDLVTDRAGNALTRGLEFAMPVTIFLPLQVEADTTDVQVFAPVRTIAAVTGLAVTVDEDTSTATATVTLATEVQQPFELHAIEETSTPLPTDIQVGPNMSGGDDDLVIRTDAECFNSTADCSNTWTFTYTTSSQDDGPCSFDGDYNVTFAIRCSNESNTDCPIDSATDSVTISFSLTSADHCPAVVDTVEVTASLAVYDNAARTNARDDFVGDGTQDDGQTVDLNDWQVAYFAAPTVSTQVALSRTELAQVWVVRHQETVTTADDDVIVLLDDANAMNAAPYDTVGAIQCPVKTAAVAGNDASASDMLTATACDPPNPAGGNYLFQFKHGEGGSSVAGSPSTPIFEFDIRTDESGFDLGNDEAETMQVNAVIYIGYPNAKRAASATTLDTRQPQDFAIASSSFSAGSTGGPASSSSATTLFGLNALAVYGAGAFVVLALISVIAVVTRSRPSSSPRKLQSTTELVTTSSAV